MSDVTIDLQVEAALATPEGQEFRRLLAEYDAIKRLPFDKKVGEVVAAYHRMLDAIELSSLPRECPENLYLMHIMDYLRRMERAE